MSITVQFSFDDTWAARIAAMAEDPPRVERDEIIQTLLLGAGTDWASLSAKQRWKVLVLRDTMERLMNYEGNEAADAAAQVVIDDIMENFPLEIGPA